MEAEGKKDRQAAPAAKELTVVERVDHYASHADDEPVWSLEGRLSQYEQRSAGLEALLLDRENDNRSVKEQLITFQSRAFDSEICPADDEGGNNTCEHCIPCSPVKIQRTGSRGADDCLSCAAQYPEGTEVTNAHHDHAKIKLTEPVLPDNHKSEAFYMEATDAHDVSVLNDMSAAAPKSVEQEQRPNVPRDHPYMPGIEEKEVYTDPGNARTQTSTTASRRRTCGTTS